MMKKINLKNLLVASMIASTSALAVADNFNEKYFVAGVVTGAVLNNVFTADKYANEPVYIHDNRYYYGGSYRNGYYYHDGVKLYGGKYYYNPRFYNNHRNYRVFMTDRYYNEPVYVYHGRYYYGGKYKHGRYYFKGYRLSGGIYCHYPRIHHKYRFANNDPRMYENYENNDRIRERNIDTRSYNNDGEYDQDDARYQYYQSYR